MSVNDSSNTQMLDLVGSTTNILNNLGEAFGKLEEQSRKLNALDSTKEASLVEVRALMTRLREHAATQEESFKEMKKTLQDDIPNQISEHMKGIIKEQVRAEIITQTTQQVDIQIREHIPVPLSQQAEENKQRLAELNMSLANSEARSSNSRIKSAERDWDETLVALFTPSGKKSNYFPADLRSLFAYDADSKTSLFQEYELADDTEEMNMKRFLSHIGDPL